DEFDKARVLVAARGESNGALRGRHAAEQNIATFCLGNNLLRDDQQISLAQGKVALFQRIRQAHAEIVARTYFADAFERDELQGARHAMYYRPVIAIPASGIL